MHVEEVHGEQEHGGQQRLLGMEDGGDVEHPARHDDGRLGGEEQDQAGEADDRGTPERRPVVELLPVGPAVEVRPWRAAQEPAEHAADISQILQVGHHGSGTEPLEGLAVAPDVGGYDHQVDHEDGHPENGRGTVDYGLDTRSADQGDDRLRPIRMGEHQAGSGEHQGHEADRVEQVDPAPDSAEAAEIHRLGMFKVLRVALALPAVHEFPIEPQDDVGPEEQEHPIDQELHRLLGDEQVRMLVEVVRVAMGMEAEEVLGRILVAGVAGLEAIVRMHPRGRVVDPLHAVAAVAVEALRGVGETQTGDLAMIGGEVGSLFEFVAITAVLGDGQLHRVSLRRGDCVSRVAIGADGGLGVFLLHHQLAVHGSRIRLLLLFVAAAADLGILQAVLGALLAAQGADVVGLMAVDAGGVDLAAVQLVGLRMDRMHVAVDLLDDHAQTLVFGIRTGLLIRPLLFVAFGATDALGQRFLMRQARDVVVATHAELLGVDAAIEHLLVHEDVDFRPVGPLGDLFILIAVAVHAATVGDDFFGRLGAGLFGGVVGAQGDGRCQQAKQSGQHPD